MVWERIKRISEAEPGLNESGAVKVQIDRVPPEAWSRLFHAGPEAKTGLGATLSGQEIVLHPAKNVGASTEATSPHADASALASVDAQILRANLAFETEVLTPALVELMGGLEARDPGDLSVRLAQTAGVEPDREEADRAEHELSNEAALLVENEGNAMSRPIDAPLCDALLKAGGVDKRG